MSYEPVFWRAYSIQRPSALAGEWAVRLASEWAVPLTSEWAVRLASEWAVRLASEWAVRLAASGEWGVRADSCMSRQVHSPRVGQPEWISCSLM